MSNRQYQADFKQAVYKAWHEGAVNVMGVMPTGSGKSHTAGEMVKEFDNFTNVIAHRQELVGQLSMSIARQGVQHQIIAPDKVRKFIISEQLRELGANMVNPNSPVAVIGVDTMIRRHSQYDRMLKRAAFWITDECFPAGTLVDGIPIETLRAGDTVTAFNEHTGEFEPRKVIRLFKNPAPEHMVQLVVKGHHVLDCTLGHPFWTKRGWVEAAWLRDDDEILLHQLHYGDHGNQGIPAVSLSKEWSDFLQTRLRLHLQGSTSSTASEGSASCRALSHVRRYGRSVRSSQKSIRKNRKGVLQQNMFRRLQSSTFLRNDVSNQSQVRQSADENPKSYAPRGGSEKSIQHPQAHRSSTNCQGWERATPYRPRDIIDHYVRRSGFPVTVDSKNWCFQTQRAATTKSLQNRLLSSRSKNSNRGRWFESLLTEASGVRSEKRHFSEWVRLDSASIFKRADFGGVVNSCHDGHVYNIEVEGLHTYVADGVVVHNCHHILKDNKWGKVCQMMPNARGLGLTATPIRADGRGLGRHADGLMDAMVEGPTMRTLIDQGYLTDYRIFAPPSDVDYSHVNIGQSGEYVQAQLKTAVRESHLIGDVVQHYLRIAPGKLGITFAESIETATDISRQFNAAGVPSEVVTANTPDRERAEIIRRFRNKQLWQLVNVDLFGEGFDLPAIEVVSMARRTQSYALYSQQFGRALRPLESDPNKTAIIIDHAGNVMLHGLPDKERIWSLDSRDKRPACKNPDDDIPLRYCVECTQPYSRIHRCCPWCGHYPVPEDRSAPEHVDGDLHELSPDALAAMRGAAADAVMDPNVLVNRARFAGAPEMALNNIWNKGLERQQMQYALQESIAWFAHLQHQRGRSQSESYRLFYHHFGINVLGAQALGRPDALLLAGKINHYIGAAA